MKRVISILLFYSLTKVSFGQSKPIVGAWIWSDSIKQTSLFFKEDGTIQMHSGPKGGVILANQLKNGTYVLTPQMLTIKWTDNSIEKDKVKFIDKNSFVLIAGDKNKQTNQTFKRVVDEEVIEEK